MLAEFKEHIKKEFPELLEQKFLLACSGGVDSTVLTHLCAMCNLDFEIAHCNFKLRGKESENDELFVNKLAKELNIDIHVNYFDTDDYAQNHKVSVQMAARELRYNWFNELKLNLGIKTLVTAHHLDDDLETFIINLSRGTGVQGLKGIPAKTDWISRPLLTFSREKIEAFARNAKVDWREDTSNSETKYLRNKIRHDIVPQLKELHPTFLENFKKTQKNLRQSSSLNENYITHLKERVFEGKGDLIRINIELLSQLKPIQAYLYGLFHEFGFTAWADIEQLLSSLSGKEVKSKTHRLVKDRDCLLLTKIKTEKDNSITISKDEREIKEPLGLTFFNTDLISETNTNTLYVDKETLKYPLVLRKWEKGDYFYPLGMKGRKKLSKFFKDEKIDIIAKERQWLLCSGNKIVWVVGKRADERFKVTNKTKVILKIVLHT